MLSHDPFERLLAAVICCAWRDATGRNKQERAAALAWLLSPCAEEFCDWLGLPVDQLRRQLKDDTPDFTIPAGRDKTKAR